MAKRDATTDHRGLADKRRAITRGALRVFGRDGYTRASIDAIAAESSVSTRTIYNHFQDKEHLFLAVVQESATQVAEAQIAMIERYLDDVTDLERDLTRFARVWAMPMAEYVDHFAMVRQITAEIGHLPQEALDAWLQAGPSRVRGELTRRMQRFADEKLLHIVNADRAASHFVLLVATEVANRTYHGAVPLPDKEISAIATDGVQAFLYGYLP